MTLRNDSSPDGLPKPKLTLGIASVPMQPWEEPYKPEEALKKGTMFPGLYFPFFVGGENNG